MIEIWCLGPGLGWILRAQHSGQQSQGHGASNQPIERKLKYVATRIFYPETLQVPLKYTILYIPFSWVLGK